MIKVALAGAAGRMGRMILGAMEDNENLSLVAALERPDHPFLGKSVHEITGLGDEGVTFTDSFPTAPDVCIDFSLAPAVPASLERCTTAGCALVLGTTGLDATMQQAVDEAAVSIALLQASNMSLGVNLLLKVVRDVSKALGEDYDLEIVETHHHNKKDSPSGTALSLAHAAAEGRGQDLDEVACYGREGAVGERPRGEIGLHAVRAGDVVGEHRVLFAGGGELIEIMHRAHSREVFAKGAVRAAEWLAGKPTGRYSMSDVLFG
ncbi:MAG: 4-hydroxy-tetrahydrodipicolinate reductase [Planctomycetota bacterium]